MANNKEVNDCPPTILSKGEKIDKVFESSVKKALKRHKNAGNSIAVWRDGKVVLIAPDQIKA